MQSYNFYPGPSKLYPQVKGYLEDAFNSGILERNHRSEMFMSMLAETKFLLAAHLNIPRNYKIYFCSSATECWEILAQSLIYRKTQFLYNGAFGKKWFKYSVTNPQNNNLDSLSATNIRGSRFFVDNTIDDIEIDNDNNIICAAVSETSNGSYINNESVKLLRKKSSEALLLFDATSNLGGYNYDISLGDAWFASVQKCFGLPSGLAMLIISDKAFEQAQLLNERNHYNSLLFLEENFKKNQTNYTPNILGIYVLKRLLEEIENIETVAKKLETRGLFVYNELKNLEPLVKNDITRSNNILTFKSSKINNILEKTENNNIILGKGYGEWKKDTFRIANFPAIPDSDFDYLIEFLKRL